MNAWPSRLLSLAATHAVVLRRAIRLGTFLLPLASGAVAGAGTIPVAHIQWMTRIGAPIYNPPRVSGGVIYLDTAQAQGANVFAVQNGHILWRFATRGAIEMPVTLGGSQVFVASDIGGTHFMRALSQRTGRLVWNYQRGQPAECMCSHIIHYAHRLLFAQTDGHGLYAFYPRGNLPTHRLWAFAGDGAKLTPPVVANQMVLVGSGDHCLYALARHTGKVVWKQATGYAFVAQPAIWRNIIIVGNRGGTVHAYAVNTGTPLWSFSTNGPIDTSAVPYGNLVFVAAGKGDRGVYALSAHTGKQIWYAPMADYTDYAPAVVDTTLIVASRDGDALGINPVNGKVRWSTKLGGVPFSPPVVMGHAVVLKVGDHRLVSLSARTGSIQWAYHTRAVITTPVVESGAAGAGLMPSMPAMPGMKMPEQPRRLTSVYIGTSSGKLLALD